MLLSGWVWLVLRWPGDFVVGVIVPGLDSDLVAVFRFGVLLLVGFVGIATCFLSGFELIWFLCRCGVWVYCRLIGLWLVGFGFSLGIC